MIWRIIASRLTFAHLCEPYRTRLSGNAGNGWAIVQRGPAVQRFIWMIADDFMAHMKAARRMANPFKSKYGCAEAMNLSLVLGLASNPLRDDDGQIQRWYRACTDIEDRSA